VVWKDAICWSKARGKTVIIVTHQLQLLRRPEVDVVALLKVRRDIGFVDRVRAVWWRPVPTRSDAAKPEILDPKPENLNPDMVYVHDTQHGCLAPPAAQP
jgi:hypothetical protein